MNVKIAQAEASSKAETSSTCATQSVQQARIDLAAAHRITVMENLNEGTWNHFSVAVPGRPRHLLLTPGNTHFSRVTASSLLITDAGGEVVEGDGVPDLSAWAIHYPIHQARPDIVCALHVHSPAITALSMIDGWRLDERGSQNASHFYGNVAYFEYLGIVDDTEEGEHMATALDDKTVLFMANHGVLVVGTSVGLAMLRLYLLNRACQAELLALSTGKPIRSMSEEAARANAERESHGVSGYLDGMKRALDVSEPDYTD